MASLWNALYKIYCEPSETVTRKEFLRLDNVEIHRLSPESPGGSRIGQATNRSPLALDEISDDMCLSSTTCGVREAFISRAPKDM